MDRNLSYPAWEVESAVQRNLGNKNDSHVLLLKLIVVVPPEESDAQSSAAEKCPNDRRAGTTVLFTALSWSNLLKKENLTN